MTAGKVDRVANIVNKKSLVVSRHRSEGSEWRAEYVTQQALMGADRGTGRELSASCHHSKLGTPCRSMSTIESSVLELGYSIPRYTADNKQYVTKML